jgi:dTDP-glucose 4,6-dehydratase
VAFDLRQGPPGHDRRYAIGCDKLTGELGMTAQTALAGGLARTVDWYIANEAWWRPIVDGGYRDWVKQHYGAAS